MSKFLRMVFAVFLFFFSKLDTLILTPLLLFFIYVNNIFEHLKVLNLFFVYINKLMEKNWETRYKLGQTHDGIQPSYRLLNK